MVEVATSRSIPSMQFQHWLKVLYVFEALHIAGGALPPDGSEVRRDIAQKIPGALSLRLVRGAQPSASLGFELEYVGADGAQCAKELP